MNVQKIVKGILVIVCIAFFIYLLSQSQCQKKPLYHRATLHSQAGYAFQISSPIFWEVSIPVLCEGKKGGEIIFPTVAIGFVVPSRTLQFQLLENQSEGLVAIIEHQAPQTVWAIYNLRDVRNSWPSPDSGMSKEEQYEILDVLLRRLEQSFGMLFEAHDS